MHSDVTNARPGNDERPRYFLYANALDGMNMTPTNDIYMVEKPVFA